MPVKKQTRRTMRKPWELKSVHSLPHGKGTRVNLLVKEYLTSERYRVLADQTKKMYLCAIRAMEDLILPNGHNLMVAFSHHIDYGIADYVKRVYGFNLKPATLGLYFTVYSNIWDLGLRNGRVAYNPWNKCNIKVDNLRDITWTPEQIELAINTSKELGFKLLAAYIAIAYHTAQRPWSDLRNLKWDNLKLDRNGCNLLDFKIQKTGVRMLLPLSDEVMEVIKELPRLSEYIFVTNKGERLTQQTITTQFSLVKKYAMLDKALLIRDLRRTAVTEMAMSGATVSEITAATGWKVTDKIINRYAVMKLTTAQNCLNKRQSFRKSNVSTAEDTTVCREAAPET